MTNKEALIKSTDRFLCEELRDPETGEIIQQEHEMLPLTLAYFLKNMAALFVGVIDITFAADFPDVTIGKEKIKGKAKRNPNAFDYIRVLHGDDFIRHTVFFQQLQGFINWWLDQEADSEDIENMWYDFYVLAGKWNQFNAQEKIEQENEEE